MNKVRQVIEERGVKFCKIAEILGISDSALATRFKRSEFKQSELEKIASFLKISISDLFDDQDEKEKQEQHNT